MKLRFSTAAVFCLALLLAQWLGLQHRIAHAALSETATGLSALAQDKAASERVGGSHDCKLFDHAAHGDGVANVAPCAQVFSPAFLSFHAMPWLVTTLRHLHPLAQGPPELV
jgi:hypothetical protein